MGHSHVVAGPALFSLPAAVQAGQCNLETDRQMLTQLENEWLVARDTATFNRILAEDFVHPVPLCGAVNDRGSCILLRVEKHQPKLPELNTLSQDAVREGNDFSSLSEIPPLQAECPKFAAHCTMQRAERGE